MLRQHSDALRLCSLVKLLISKSAKYQLGITRIKRQSPSTNMSRNPSESHTLKDALCWIQRSKIKLTQNCGGALDRWSDNLPHWRLGELPQLTALLINWYYHVTRARPISSFYSLTAHTNQHGTMKTNSLWLWTFGFSIGESSFQSC